MTRSPEYRAWWNLLARCLNSNDPDYGRYGGRGIKVCEAWRLSFGAFYADVGGKPSKAHSIDRRDNDGHYSCGHCEECVRNGWPANHRWTTQKEQCRNSTHVKLLEFDGKTMAISDWAKSLGIKERTLSMRITNGWSTEKALTTPSGRFRRLTNAEIERVVAMSAQGIKANAIAEQFGVAAESIRKHIKAAQAASVAPIVIA